MRFFSILGNLRSMTGDFSGTPCRQWEACGRGKSRDVETKGHRREHCYGLRLQAFARASARLRMYPAAACRLACSGHCGKPHDGGQAAKNPCGNAARPLRARRPRLLPDTCLPPLACSTPTNYSLHNAPVYVLLSLYSRHIPRPHASHCRHGVPEKSPVIDRKLPKMLKKRTQTCNLSPPL